MLVFLALPHQESAPLQEIILCAVIATSTSSSKSTQYAQISFRILD